MMTKINNKILEADPHKFIIIKGARVNNLRNIDVVIPRNKFVVMTGPSGSGKSSLAFDTLFAEGQRRYVESLNTYARQFLERMDKPEVDYIKGVSPAIAIEQKVNNKNPRSTVGTSTEIYDYLKLLYARIGKTYSPVSGKEVKCDTVSDIVNFVNNFPDKSKFQIFAPQIIEKKFEKKADIKRNLEILLQKGFTRVAINREIKDIEKLLADLGKLKIKSIEILVDRIAVNKESDNHNFRLADSIQIAFEEGGGYCKVEHNNDEIFDFSTNFECDGIVFEKPSPEFFSFNTSYGACPTCEGFGSILGIDEDLVIPEKYKSIFDGAIAPWRSEKMKGWLNSLLKNAHKFNFPVHRPWYELTSEEKELIWEGNAFFEGLNAFCKYLESESFKIQYRVMLSRYRGKTTCPDCKGTRLRKDAGNVKLLLGEKVKKVGLNEIVNLAVKDAITLFSHLELNDYEKKVSTILLYEIRTRLKYLSDVGLGYLSLNRLSSSLSGGEAQRINLATTLGSSLVGSIYVLDEPSIGLHARDTDRLIGVLNNLKKAGNSVIVVEHDEGIIAASDYIFDLGPGAGSNGGNLVFEGSYDQICKDKASLTGKYLNGTLQVEQRENRRTWREFVELKGCTTFNLKNIDVKFPLVCMTVVTGVSGSGKTTLIKKILHPFLLRIFDNENEKAELKHHLGGNLDLINGVEMVDQNPIGRSSRSNPVTYVKAYDYIRQLFADVPLSKNRGYRPSHYSFNVDGGRCDECEGEGTITVEMQFMADLKLKCESCKGKRFKEEVLEILYKGKNISDILNLTIEDAILFFSGGREELLQNSIRKTTHKALDNAALIERLRCLFDVGLGYLKLGQSSSTLSGGEAQRIKLASFLGKGGAEPRNTIYIFDEPTTGLHFDDINKLLKALNSLIDQGNTVIIVEHNLEVIRSADWIIDLGPEGGDEGGNVQFEGTPEELIKLKNNFTGSYLKPKLNGHL